jgi:membrane-associated protease RseP (regulator of RpoE activity)
MQKMDKRMGDETQYRPEVIQLGEPEVIQAEIVEVAPGVPWEWQERRPVRPRRRRWLPLILFFATCLSTWWVGALDFGGLGVRGVGLLSAVWEGLAYAVPVMTILLCHEMGHFLQAHRYGVYASLPYFIPMPLPPLGTFGAVIAMEPRIGGRRALFDIGISGPLAGLVPTFIFLVIGLEHASYKVMHGGMESYGDPLVLRFLATYILGPAPKGQDLMIGPVGFAGWVGLLITSLNLIPIGQLDGGHVLYALLRKKAHKVATLLLFAAIFLVVWDWKDLRGWTLMLFLLFMMGPIHPPTANDDEPLGIGRIILGWLTLAFIIIGFTPTPIIFPS